MSYGYPPNQGPYGPYGAPPPASTSGSTIAALIANIISTVLCCGVLSIPGIVLAAMALNRQHTDPVSAKNLTMWSWVSFGVGLILGIALVIALFAFGLWAELENGTYGTGSDIGSA